jgi:GntR family transcriptional regulator/MocR family aminotransferase
LAISKQSNPSVSGGFPADLLVELDRTRPRNLREQLERSLRQAIASGVLSPRTVLPPSRALAADLQVSRAVVVTAYEHLVADGYLEARRGSSTLVRGRGAVRGPWAGGQSNMSAAPEKISGIWGSGLPDPALFPRDEWLRRYREVLRGLPDACLGYPLPQGVTELRVALAGYLGRVRGVPADAEQVVVCGGFSQGLVLLSGVLRERGVTRVAVEDPCFSFHRRILQDNGLHAVPVPVDRQGMQVSRLAGLNAGAVVLSPAHSYPSGAVLSADRRVELIEWARATGGLVVEDDYDAEFRYDRLPVGALAGLDPGHVIYIGSVSKVLSPAVRLGWIIAPPGLVDDLIRAKFYADFASEALGQYTLAAFIESGGFARHLRRVRPVYRSRRDALLKALDEHLPEVRPRGEAAGLHLLLELPAHLDPEAMRNAAAAHGLHLEDATRHWADPRAAPPALLVGYGWLDETTLARSVRALGHELRLRA